MDAHLNCILCPAGKQVINGTCQNCPISTYSENGNGSCLPCPLGHFGFTSGMASCTPCREGTKIITIIL